MFYFVIFRIADEAKSQSPDIDVSTNIESGIYAYLIVILIDNSPSFLWFDDTDCFSSSSVVFSNDSKSLPSYPETASASIDSAVNTTSVFNISPFVEKIHYQTSEIQSDFVKINLNSAKEVDTNFHKDSVNIPLSFFDLITQLCKVLEDLPMSKLLACFGNDITVVTKFIHEK